MNRYVVAFVLTLLIEVPIYVSALRLSGVGPQHRDAPPSPLRVARLGVMVNVVTHPVAFALAVVCTPAPYGWVWFAAIELAVVTVEAALLHWRGAYPWETALGASCVANSVSCGVGIIALWPR